MSQLKLCAGVALVLASAAAIAAKGVEPFEEATMFVEQNATDGDTEVVITGTAADEGLRQLRIESPDRRKVVTLLAPDASALGIREFHFESPEPPGEAVLAAYPEGDYVLYGKLMTGAVLRSVLTLSHQLPAEPTILEPADEAEVPDGPVTVSWSTVTGITGYVLEVENESADPEQAFTLDLAPDTTSFDIPDEFIVSGGEYQVGVHAVGDNGNIIVVETTFTVAE